MPFGLPGAAATFQRLINEVLAPQMQYASAYIADIVIYTKAWGQHLRALKAMLRELRAAGLMANLHKCTTAKRETKYLGFLVGHGTIRPLADKFQVIWDFVSPKQNKKPYEVFFRTR